MFAAERISYQQAQSFSTIVRDYLNGAAELRPFYDQPPSLEGIKEAIKRRKKFPTDRTTLVQLLKEQYDAHQKTPEVEQNMERLLSDNCFTVCTAHQPNLFTGPLYFIYKILHTIRLAATLKSTYAEYDFVPVYYMGSEDADFAELNHTYVAGKRIEWKREQSGAVGRMLVDASLVRLIDELEGQLVQEAHGPEVIALLRRCYTNGRTIQDATFEIVNELYGRYGLIVLIPDNPGFKAQMKAVFTDDLFHHIPAEIVAETSKKLSAHYNVQAHPRDINLFYLKDDIRSRIVEEKGVFQVHEKDIRFTAGELQRELAQFPERFSPNVILRGLYQETILPNLIFVGGGGELAYWLQLKDLFAHYEVPYPMLLLRNSFLVIEKKWKDPLHRIELPPAALFSPEAELMNQVVEKHSEHAVRLNGSLENARALYGQIRSQASAIDATLEKHVAALEARSIRYLEELEKKMLRAEKRKFGDHQRQIRKIKEELFPNNGLQERVENFSRFYAKWGREFMEALYTSSLAFEQEFTILTEE